MQQSSIFWASKPIRYFFYLQNSKSNQFLAFHPGHFLRQKKTFLVQFSSTFLASHNPAKSDFLRFRASFFNYFLSLLSKTKITARKTTHTFFGWRELVRCWAIMMNLEKNTIFFGGHWSSTEIINRNLNKASLGQHAGQHDPSAC